MRTLYIFQKRRQLCDVTLVSHDDSQEPVHAGVLAAASSMMRKKLEECKRGIYTILTPFSRLEMVELIHFAYTGYWRIKQMKHIEHVEQLFCGLGLLQSENEMSHMKTVIKSLQEFAAKGLFCNMGCYRRNEGAEPTQSYVVAAKYPILAHIPNNSLVIAHIGNVVKAKQKLKASTFKQHSSIPSVKKQSEAFFRSTLKADKTSLKFKRTFVCDICCLGFIDQPYFVNGELVHSQPFPKRCYSCYKSVDRNLPSHKLIAIGPNSYMCPLCHTQFKNVKINQM